MKDILDEQLEEREVLEPIPLVIYALIVAVLIFLTGALFKIQSWPYSSEINLIGIFSIVIIGIFSFKAFKIKNDLYLNMYYFFFLLGGFSKIILLFIPYRNTIWTVLNLCGFFFIIGLLLTLTRYFTLRRPQKTSLNIIRYPLLLVTPIWIIGFFFKIQSWPYASEMLTISVFLFLLGTILMVILKLKKENPAFRLITVWLVLMANILALGLLFKIQSWPYASELISSSFVGGVLGIIVKLMQQQKLLKEQEETENND